MRTLSTSYVHCQNAAPHPQAVGLEYVRHRTTRICVHQFCSWACSNEAIPMRKRMKVSHFETLRNSDAKCAKNAKIRFVVFDLSSVMFQLFARAGFWHLPALLHLATRTQIVARRQGRIALAQPTAAKAFLVARKVALTAPEKSRDKFMETIGNDKGCAHWQTAFKGQAARKDT